MSFFKYFTERAYIHKTIPDSIFRKWCTKTVCVQREISRTYLTVTRWPCKQPVNSVLSLRYQAMEISVETRGQISSVYQGAELVSLSEDITRQSNYMMTVYSIVVLFVTINTKLKKNWQCGIFNFFNCFIL